MIDKLLQEIGMSENEAKLYVVLLRYGQQPITFLSKKAGLNRGLGYVLLHSLLEKGLVTKSSKGKVLSFAALEPSQLLTYLENKKKEIDQKKEHVQSMLGQLTAIQNPLTSKPKIRFFDGRQGAKTVLETILNAETKTLQAFLSVRDIIDFVGEDFIRNFMESLAKREHTVEAIRTQEKKMEKTLDTNNYFITDNKQHRAIRFASPELTFPMTIFLFDDKVAIISSPKEDFALIIESKEYVEMQKKLFQMLWSSLERTTIRVGILHSLTGTMAISERPMVDSMLMAINEINEQGGILGRRIDPIVVDGESNPTVFAKQAKLLIQKHSVSSIFGGWTSASRKTMMPIFEEHDHLLWYPVQYEGLEQSKNIIYTGAAPNQQMLPAVDWAMKHLGKKFFLVGSDYIFPRCAHEIMKGRIEELGGTVVGEAYEHLGGRQFDAIVKDIKKAKPDVILNTINGDSNVDFFTALHHSGITPKNIPTISFSIGEEEISRMHPETMAGNYAAWSYFQGIPTKKNEQFVRNFQTKYGRHRVTDDPIETAYYSVYLFAEAVKKAGTDDVDAIREAAKGIDVLAPEGKVFIDPDNQHCHRFSRIGQLQENGQFDIVWSSDSPIKPDPYPKYKSQAEWARFLQALHKKWKGHWAK